jgi:glycosyltransferase involved in cell wall biosynthesis
VEPAARVPVTVVVPTLGKLAFLRACLQSLCDCRPRASEILIIDASGTREIDELVASFADVGALRLDDPMGGIPKAANLGLHEASHKTVLFTHDDCEVSPDWVGIGARLIEERPGVLLAGSVYPRGDPRAVTGLAMNPEPRT